MTLDEVKLCADETLTYFLKNMPDVPFTRDDIIIHFTRQKDMARRAKELCKKYVPDKTINDSQAQQLVTSIAANALIGKEKSAVLVCEDYKTTKKEWRMLFFHELMHIFCAKTEMDGLHFIDIYGSGTTPEFDPEYAAPEFIIRDGYLSAGYYIWTEFIAHYYALLKVSGDTYGFPNVVDYVYELLGEVNIATDELSKGSFAMACSYLLSCCDVAEILNPPNDIDDNSNEVPYEKENKLALLNCLRLLHKQLQSTKPWRITEDFIENLGSKYCWFKTTNSMYLANL